MSTAGAGLAKARRKLGTVSRSLRLTRKGTLATSTGLQEAAAEVRGATSKMRDLSVPLRKGAVDIMKLIDDSFAFQRDPGGEPWEALDDSTVEARIRNLMFGRSRGKKHHAVSSRSGATFMKTRREKAAETRAKSKKLTKKRQLKAAEFRSKMKILVDTGRLKNSWFARAGKTSITFGTNTVYGDYHQRGAGVPVRKQAPVEYVNGQWRLIKLHPAKLVFDRIGKSIQDYIAPEID